MDAERMRRDMDRLRELHPKTGQDTLELWLAEQWNMPADKMRALSSTSGLFDSIPFDFSKIPTHKETMQVIKELLSKYEVKKDLETTE